MTIYCYLCGQPEQVTPTVVNVIAHPGENLQSTFAQTIVALACHQLQDR
jgi:hypothetical protein